MAVVNKHSEAHEAGEFRAAENLRPEDTPSILSKHKRLISAGAVLALSAASFFIATNRSGNSDRAVSAAPAATADANPTPSSAPVTEAPVLELPSYVMEFEPAFPYSMDPSEILQQVRTTTYRAAFAKTPELRDRYLRFLVGNDEANYNSFLEHNAHVRRAIDAAGLTPEQYLEQEANIYTFQEAHPRPNGGIAINYISSDPTDANDTVRTSMVLVPTPASDEFPERFIFAPSVG